MKPDTVINGSIGIGGTLMAFVTPENAGVFAGVCTGLWMLWQFGCSAYDRFTKR